MISIRKFWAFLVVALCFAVLPSCDNDDEDSETKPSMIGDLKYDLPMYAFAGEVIELEGSGILYPDASKVSYKWTSANLLQDTVYGTTCTIQVPDSLGDYSIVFSAQSDGYYDKTATKYLTSLKLGENGSLTGIPDTGKSFCDPRDGQTYKITEAGNLVWFAENLNWKGAGSAYGKADAIGYFIGRLYTWEDATGGVSASGLGKGPQGVCPEGWSVPTKEDWEDLGKALGGENLVFEDSWKGLGDNVMVDAKINGFKFWEYTPLCNPENMFGWAALSAGSCTNNYNNYSGLRVYAFWWSATEMSADKAYYRYIYCERPDFDVNYSGKDNFGASVRCVRLKETTQE
ncbi:MAG: hypothetical protein IKU18_05965 [Bacteroidales bacterium]|nr:hypothetical protein [Bacteroidales bacterium]